MSQAKPTSESENNMKIDVNAKEASASQKPLSLQNPRASSDNDVHRDSRVIQECRKSGSFFDSKKKDKRSNTKKIRDVIRARNKVIAKNKPVLLILEKLRRLPVKSRMLCLNQWMLEVVGPEILQEVFQMHLAHHKEYTETLKHDKRMARALANVQVPKLRGKIEEIARGLGSLKLSSEGDIMK
ncbi:hypothetical protein N7507_011622 [Penicillium longicatenatum]|nr:hypothetical protein N7507_011622 [Penicillium longicatenatum]